MEREPGRKGEFAATKNSAVAICTLFYRHHLKMKVLLLLALVAFASALEWEEWKSVSVLKLDRAYAWFLTLVWLQNY